MKRMPIDDKKELISEIYNFLKENPKKYKKSEFIIEFSKKYSNASANKTPLNSKLSSYKSELQNIGISIEDDIIYHSQYLNILLKKLKFNTIIYGAPGTGKSYEVNEIMKSFKKENIFRTMFYEDYSYFDFMGQYKPTMLLKDSMGHIYTENDALIKEKKEPVVSYDFVSGVFLEAYIQAYKKESDYVFLIIEELNRGNCSSIFGDIFQLLDRDSTGNSMYPINTSKELKNYLIKIKEKENITNLPTEHLTIPSNFKIIATMNTSDQSLFPIDSAFKRRWSMVFSPIKYDEEDIKDIRIENTKIKWVDFLKEINDLIIKHLESDNKQVGPYFLIPEDKEIKTNDIKEKLLHYLFFDVFRHHRNEVFKSLSFSELYQKEINQIFKDAKF